MSNQFALNRLQRTPSIRSCFPGRYSGDDSTTTSSIVPNTPQSPPDVIPSLEPEKLLVSPFIQNPNTRIPVIRNHNHQALRVIPDSTIVPNASGMGEAPTVSADQPSNTIAAPHGFLPNPIFSPGDKTSIRLTMFVPLYKAALKGDWETAKHFFYSHPGAVRAKITRGWETPLHIAAGSSSTWFVEELVKLMSPEDLALQNKDNNTALCFAAASGITKIAKVMVEKNNYLPHIRGSQGATPLYMAAILGRRDMVWYLYDVTRDEDLTKEDRIGLLVATITTNLYDVALHILKCHPELATARDGNGETALHLLARKPSTFASGSRLRVWHRCIYSWIHVELPHAPPFSHKSSGYKAHLITEGVTNLNGLLWHVPKLLGINVLYDEKLMHIQAVELVKNLWEQILDSLDDSQIGDLLREPSRALFIATEFGIVEFITELIHSYPDLIWKVDNQSRSIFHIAVVHRQVKIFNLIYEIGAHKDVITSYRDDNNNNMLHLAGKLAPLNRLNIVSGAALQMQRELLWFKEVEKIIQPLYMEMRNSEGKIPRILFTEEHKGLVKEGEKWMKDTATSCMLVATLITTVMFAAIFTIPGGNSSDKGIPIFLQTNSFIIFTVSDALALFSSVTSILVFLSILTSRYAEEDFLKSLPNRLIIGLTTLFFSIVTMLIAFSAAFFMVLGHRLAWVVIPSALVTCIPVTLFAFLQFPLLADMVHSTYGSSFFVRQTRHMLF